MMTKDDSKTHGNYDLMMIEQERKTVPLKVVPRKVHVSVYNKNE